MAFTGFAGFANRSFPDGRLTSSQFLTLQPSGLLGYAQSSCRCMTKRLYPSNGQYTQARVMKLVDMGDSKSPVRENVAVRVRPLVPSFYFLEPKDFCS